jgi:hypothetical protein
MSFTCKLRPYQSAVQQKQKTCIEFFSGMEGSENIKRASARETLLNLTFPSPSNLSLTGCSPAEPVSVSFDGANIRTRRQNQILKSYYYDL